jgi:uncharacterized protein YmfQ (DUF2313 family)
MNGRFHQALAELLPMGWAWPRESGSVWMRLLAGLAASHEELHAYIQQSAVEWLPQHTRTRLGEWELSCGLPDACFGPMQSTEERRASLLARLRGYAGVYADSSPAALGSIAAYCAALGFAATVAYHTPFRVGRHRVGRRLGANDGKLWITVTGTNTPLRVGRRIGARLVDRNPAVGELACALEAVVPARYSINVVVV